MVPLSLRTLPCLKHKSQAYKDLYVLDLINYFNFLAYPPHRHPYLSMDFALLFAAFAVIPFLRKNALIASPSDVFALIF